MSHVHGEPMADPVPAALAVLRRRFPGACLWFGTSTRRWWACVDGRLVEARTARELSRHLALAGAYGRTVSGASDALAPAGEPARPPAEPEDARNGIRHRWPHRGRVIDPART